MNAANSIPFAKWMPAAAAGGLLAAVVAAGVISGGGSSGDTASTVTTFSTPAPVETANTVNTEPEVTVAPEDQVTNEGSTAAKIPLSQTLSNGMAGSEVQMVQERLVELGFDPGPTDGVYGNLTIQSVWAFEKLVLGTHRTEVSGRVTPDMWDRMQDPIKVQPRLPTGGLADHVEIYLPEQVMVVFHADEPAVITHISTGELMDGATSFTPWYETAAEYCETVTIDTNEYGEPVEPYEKAVCGRSYTPPGVFEAYKMIEGRRQSALGGMYDPIYINQGIAIHGALTVPEYPASHGCIRVSQYLGEKLQGLIDIGDQVLIYDGETDPWNQSKEAMQMRFDYPDPDATTTTTSTTTTTTTTTTTVPDEPVTTTTQAPAPATTTTPPTTTAPTTTTEPDSQSSDTTVPDDD
ncbi:MAG: hypothetical protein CL424_03590 [Acidimicrobiaceae bacterium]|nr:hypothetical protein [Acidimicrobiaceae bacterium]